MVGWWVGWWLVGHEVAEERLRGAVMRTPPNSASPVTPFVPWPPSPRPTHQHEERGDEQHPGGGYGADGHAPRAQAERPRLKGAVFGQGGEEVEGDGGAITKVRAW